MKSLMRYIIISLIALLLVQIGGVRMAYALAPDSARGIALGNAFTAVGTSADALNSNPAAVGADKVFGLVIQPLWLEVYNNSWNTGTIFKYMNADLDDDAKDEILSGVPQAGFCTGMQGAGGLGLVIGPVGLSGRGVVMAGAGLARDLLEVLLKGNEVDKRYDLDGCQGSAVAYGDTGLSLSFPLHRVAEKWNLKLLRVGGTYHHLVGLGYASASIEGGYVETVLEGGGSREAGANAIIKGDITGLYSESGTGNAVDLGFYSEINDRWNVGVVVRNLGSIRWDDVTKYTYTLDIDAGEIIDSNKQFDLGEPVEEKYRSVVWHLPREYRAGVAYKILPRVLLAGDLAFISGDKSYAELGVGTEISLISFLPVRLGYNYSGLRRGGTITAGMGLYLGPVQTDLSISGVEALFDRARSIAVAMNFGIKF